MRKIVVANVGVSSRMQFGNNTEDVNNNIFFDLIFLFERKNVKNFLNPKFRILQFLNPIFKILPFLSVVHIEHGMAQ